jgi:DNA-binding MurR/RpiR family transcriptional regulator
MAGHKKTKGFLPIKTPGGVLQVIQGYLEDLRNSEKKVAQYVLTSPAKVIYQSISEVAENAGTSEPTVIRFCRALGFSGFQDLKIQLAQDLVPEIKNIHEDVEPGDDTPTLIRKIFQANINALNTTFEILNPEIVDKAIHTLAKAKRIDFFGMAGPGIVAKDAHNKFFRLGISCAYYTDPQMQNMSAALMDSKSVLVIISHSGAIKDQIEAMEIAKAAGATTIAIVSHRKSPAAKMADIPLCVYARESSFKPEPISARIAAICVIDVLFVGVALKRRKEFVTNLHKTRKALVNKFL